MLVQIESLWVYPIKSCGGVRLDAVRALPSGFERDRRWMLADQHGAFMSQRALPHMASLAVSLDAAGVTVRDADGHTLHVEDDAVSGRLIPVQIWEDTLDAAHVSDAADAFFSRALGQPCHLVRMPDDARPIRWPDDVVPGAGQHVGFADGFPSLLTTTASLDALNAALDAPVQMLRFRPNIVVSGELAPFAEDGWDTLSAEDGLDLRCVKPCARCLMINIDPATATSDGAEPLRTLARLHTVEVAPNKQRVVFGQNCAHVGQGTLRVGQTLRVLRTAP
jgi:uncharacterized protein